VAVLRSRGHECAKRQAGVLGGRRRTAGALHVAGPLHEAIEVRTHECRRDQPEEGERGEAAADVRRIHEDLAKIFGNRAAMERRPVVGDGNEPWPPRGMTRGDHTTLRLGCHHVRLDRRTGLAGENE
jgi:hypothetical protein